MVHATMAMEPGSRFWGCATIRCVDIDYIRVAQVTTCLAGNVCFGCNMPRILAVFNILYCDVP